MNLEESSRILLFTLVVSMVIPFGMSSNFDAVYAQQSTSTGIIIPLYTYPGATWDSVYQAKLNNPSVPVIAIINPNNGPGNFIDSSYLSGIQNLQSVDVIVLGYVHTLWADRDSSDSMNDIQTYDDWYGVDGIFFDEMSTNIGAESYYSNLDEFTKSLGMSLTVGNPGTDTQPSYVGSVDNLVIYETGGLPLPNYFDGWHLDFDKSNFSFLAYGVNGIDDTLIDSYYGKVEYLYITDDVLSNPWDSLPPYFDELVSFANNDSNQDFNNAPTAMDDLVNGLDLPIVIDVLANDYDIDGDTIEITSVSEPLSGTVLLNSDNTITYTPNLGFLGTDTFEYQITDNNGGFDSGLVTVSLSSPSSATLTISSYSLDGTEIFGMWTEIWDGSTLLVEGFTPLSYDLATNKDYSLWVSDWQDILFDHWEDSSIVRDRIINISQDTLVTAYYSTGTGTVNPTALDDSVSLLEDESVTINVLENDAPETSLFVSSTTNPSEGSVQINSDNTVTYAPNPDFFGTDSFEYTVSDGNGGTDSAIVTITVNSVNDAPIPIDDHMTTDENNAITTDVLANDSDPDGDTLSIMSVSTPLNGSTQINSDNTVTYAPNPDFFGTDSFEYTVSDGNGATDTAQVLVTINEVISSNTLTIQTLSIAGKEVSGLWTEIWKDDVLVVEGYSPLSYDLEANEEYSISVSNYKNYRFDHWEDGNTESFRTITISSDTVMSAYYKIPVNIHVKSVDLNGGELTGLWTELLQNDNTIQTGFTTKTFTVVSDTAYTIYMSDYQNFQFDHWKNGNTANTLEIIPSDDVTLIAYYQK